MSRPAEGAADTRLRLDLGGMTCASCAARIEKKLNRVDGVHATVNFATESATVDHRPEIEVADLVRVVEKLGYTATPHVDQQVDDDRRVRNLGRRLVVCALLSLPVVVLGMVPAAQFPGWQWLSWVLTTPVVTWGAFGFHRAAVRNLRHGATTMDTLVSLGVGAAWLWSTIALFFGPAGEIGMTHELDFSLQRGDQFMNVYFEAAAAITTFILAGRWFEARSKRSAGSAVRSLLDLGAKEVVILRGQDEVTVPVAELSVGDEFLARPGAAIATDGVVVDGRSDVDASAVTGESEPQVVGPGDTVIGATTNLTGRLVVRATRVGADTHLATITRLVEQAQTGKAPVQRLADRVSGVFVPIVIALAILTAVGWLVSGVPASFALTTAVAVLIIACPCALGLATPTALMVGSGRGAQLGIVIKGPEILEETRSTDVVVLDKTGTITTGEMSLVDVVGEPDTLPLAAAVENASEHPVARAIAGAVERPARVDDFQNLPGRGVTGTVDGRQVVVGRPDLFADADAWRDRLQQAREAGHTTVMVGVGEPGEARVVGLLAVADRVKEEAAAAVSELCDLGLRPIMLTGDHQAAAQAVAAGVGIDEVISDVLPEQKADTIARLQADGNRVAMVGDGVNDAAALATADLGIAMSTGTDVAIRASDLTLMHGDLRLVPAAMRLSRATLRTIRTNLFWAFAYNVAALPLAALGFLNPMMAGAAMALSSAFVVSNSLRLRRFRITRG